MMKHVNFTKNGLILCMALILLPLAVWAEEKLPHPDTYLPHPSKTKDIRKMLDDPKDLVATHPIKKALPPEVYEVLTFDVEEAKRQWAEIVGFKSPDVVGKIAPEIKPDKYTYKDLEQNQGLKELFPPEFLVHFKPGGPPFVGSITEFEIIPTRQLYWSALVCEATKQNLGKTKLDKDGYIVPKSWQGGIPFPRPSGKFKAQQVLYSFRKRPDSYERCLAIEGESMCFNKNLAVDRYNQFSAHFIRLMGRTIFPPYGWFDKRAERNGEYQAFSTSVSEPRSMRGTVVLQYMFDDPNKLDPWMIYVPSLRRIRKMAATDTQDPNGDQTYDDREHLVQKITPKKYPYKFDIVSEREYLMPVEYNTAKSWVDSKDGYAFKEGQFMRRPCYVLELNQMDPNYVYGRRMIYVDKENFMCSYSANYDQKGRLYRTQNQVYVFMEDIAQLSVYGVPSFQWDHLDVHCTFQMQFQLPANFSRKDFSMQELIKKGK